MMELLRLSVDFWNIELKISFLIIVISLLIIIFLYFKPKNIFTNKKFEIEEAKIGIGDNTITIKPNHEVEQITYELWVELSTRKLGIPIDFEHDVIIELYNSWYQFFMITRELIKKIPASKIKNEDTQNIVVIATEILNKSIRPHLTIYQASFRKWYNKEIEKDENNILSPQEIQEKYPSYNEIVKDIQKVNENLIEYEKKLKEIAFNE